MESTTSHLSRANREVEIVANLFGVPPEEVANVLALSHDERYRIWMQPKKGGGSRPIHCPVPILLKIQKMALENCPGLARSSSIAHGGVRRRSIVTNALPHRLSRSMVHFDLADAYGQVSSFPYSWEDLRVSWTRGKRAQTIGEIFDELFFVIYETWQLSEDRYHYCTFWRLPQGAPTSPAIFNRSCLELDLQLSKFVGRIGAVVTRYCDNIVVSWEQAVMPSTVINAVKRIIVSNHFQLNDRKESRISAGNSKDRPLRLPGVNIIDGELRLDPRMVRQFRGGLYNALKSDDLALACGIAGHVCQVYGDRPPNQLASLLEDVRVRRAELQSWS